MGRSKRQIATAVPLERLVARALKQLQKLGYSRRSLRRYRTIWRQIIAFSRRTDRMGVYSEDLAARFSDAYRLKDGERIEPSEGWRRHVVFAVHVLGEFARKGGIARSRTDMRPIQIPTLMKKPVHEYEQYCRDRCHLRLTSLHARMQSVALLLDSMRCRGVMTFAQMQPADITAFVVSRGDLRPKTISRTVSDIRLFLQFLLMRGILQRDLSSVLPTIRVPRDALIPSVWDPEQLARLLNVVDRSSPKGKRDYAIMLLASRLGLRLGDIRALTLDDLNWEAATIEIKQAKTCAPLRLPMTEEVGAALIDYLKSGRPAVNFREVFVRFRFPFQPFAENSHLHFIVRYWKELAAIQFTTPQHQGLHSLRHTLATQLLRKQTPFHVISAILGHATPSSTLIYAKADVEALRAVALNTEESDHVD